MKEQLKPVSQAFEGTSNGLDGIIEALRGHLPPEPPPFPDHPETKVWYEDGSISSFNIVGTLARNTDMTNAVKIEIGNTVTGIAADAFSYTYSKLTSIIIPSSVLRIGNSILKNCSSLVTIIIKNGVTSIGNEAFSGCSSLTSITIPNSVKFIGFNAFYNSKLVIVTFEGKTKAQVQTMSNFQWGLIPGKIVCTDGTL
jgi:hypothetical protein